MSTADDHHSEQQYSIIESMHNAVSNTYQQLHHYLHQPTATHANKDTSASSDKGTTSSSSSSTAIFSPSSSSVRGEAAAGSGGRHRRRPSHKSRASPIHQLLQGVLPTWWFTPSSSSSTTGSLSDTSPSCSVSSGSMGVVLGGTALCYQLFIGNVTSLVHAVFAMTVPLFCSACAFYWLAVYLRKSWSGTSAYVLLAACFAGEVFAQATCCSNKESGDIVTITRPSACLVLLAAVSVASIFSSLETNHSVLVITFISVLRLFSCSSLTDVPPWIRPFLAYSTGVIGIIGAKYMETLLTQGLHSPSVSAPVSVAPGRPAVPEAKVPLIKRRRSSAISAPVGGGLSSFAQRAGRRTSLPALIQKPQVGNKIYSFQTCKYCDSLYTYKVIHSNNMYCNSLYT